MVHVHVVWAAANRGLDEVTECTELVLVLHVQEHTSVCTFGAVDIVSTYLQYIQTSELTLTLLPSPFPPLPSLPLPSSPLHSLPSWVTGV